MQISTRCFQPQRYLVYDVDPGEILDKQEDFYHEQRL